jgi:CRISPR/Cas system-associated exonuclease Cas4 (RecB family)
MRNNLKTVGLLSQLLFCALKAWRFKVLLKFQSTVRSLMRVGLGQGIPPLFLRETKGRVRMTP